jgi:hypothetical protein
MLEALRTSETSVCSNETTRRYITESSNIHTRRRENLKSHFVITVRRSACSNNLGIAELVFMKFDIGEFYEIFRHISLKSGSSNRHYTKLKFISAPISGETR